MSSYWGGRVAKETWKKYNSKEESIKNLKDFYDEAILDIEEELYKIEKKLGERPSITAMWDKRRLTKLKKAMEDIVKELCNKLIDDTKTHLMETIEEQYRDVSAIIGNKDFSLPNKKEMEMMLNNPWSGMSFSERIWENNRVLSSNLNEILTRGFIQGKSIRDMSEELENRMKKGYLNSHVLVRTETMHYLNESSKKAYKDAGADEIEILAATDERTCDICGKEHGKIYSISEVPILPFHPRCRCTYIPVIDNYKNRKPTNK